jgi:hypothetical protein
MNTQSKIEWHSTLRFGSDQKWIGSYSAGEAGGTFTIRFNQAADGRCILLRHGDQFAGAFKTEAAAKRRAAAIVKQMDGATRGMVAPASTATPDYDNEYPAQFRMAGIGEIIIPETDGSAATLLKQMRCILDGRGSFDYCEKTGELLIRTGLDLQMGGDLVLLEKEGDE